MEDETIYKPEYGDSYALIVGINDYEITTKLDYAVNDADAVKQTLIDQFSFPVKNITTLLDGEATGQKIRKAFLGFGPNGSIKEDDRIFVFFAGHGVTVSGKRGPVGYLVPVDGDLEKLDTLIRWDEFTRNADLIPAKHIFFVMDACYSGLAFQRVAPSGSMRFVKNMLKRVGRQVLTAGKANETVADGNGARLGHSIFTSHLLDAFEGAAKTVDGILTANTVMAYVYNHVSSDQYSTQTPHHGFIEGDGDFVFNPEVLISLSSGEPYAGIVDDDVLIKNAPEIADTKLADSVIAARTKELLSDQKNRIALEDFVNQQLKLFLARTDIRNFPVQAKNIDKEDIVKRLHDYELATRDLQEIVILLAKWGNKDQLRLIGHIFRHAAEANKGSAGKVLWIDLGWYPMQLLLFSGIASALSTQNYHALKSILNARAFDQREGVKSSILVSVGSNMSNQADTFKLLPGMERKYVPRSEYLYITLQPILEDVLLLGKGYDELFDRTEIFFALYYSHETGRNWGPPGRFGWKHNKFHEKSPFDAFVEDANAQKSDWRPVRVGLFNGDSDHFTNIASAYKEFLDRLSWW